MIINNVEISRLPERSYLLECFRHDNNTGALYWRERPREYFGSVKAFKRFNTLCANKLLKGTTKGYVIIYLDKKSYSAHRVIWKMIYGEDSDQYIDHVNGDRSDNRIENLRKVTQKENCNNAKISKRNNTGYLGVSSRRGKWRARLRINNKTTHLGDYTTLEEAALVRELKVLELYGEEFYYGNEKNKILLEELKSKVEEIKNNR